MKSSDADVVMLAETWSQKMVDVIWSECKSVFKYLWRPRKISPFKLGSGLAFFARQPIEDRRIAQFSHLSGWDAWSQKSIASCVVDGVVYAATHLEAGWDDNGIAFRRENLEETKNHFMKLRGESKKVVFGGDLNMAEMEMVRSATTGKKEPSTLETPWYGVLKGVLAGELQFKDAFREVYPDRVKDKGVTCNHYDNYMNKIFSGPNGEDIERIDYFWTKGVSSVGFQVLTDWKRPVTPQHPGWCLDTPVKAMHLSDHFPIELTFL